MAAAKPGRMPECPRCGRRTIASNDVGAWCTGYPCRWSVKKAAASAIARVFREVFQ